MGNGRALLSPIVRKLAARHGIDLGTVQGSGATGRITREDIEAAIAQARALPQAPQAPSAPQDLSAPSAPPAPSVTTAPSVTAVQPGPRDEIQPLSRMRLTIAERMTESLRTAPHVWTAVEVDLQAVEEVRRQHKERFRREEGTSLTYLAFVARAVCDALRAFPVVNSSLDMAAKTRVLHHYVHLGIAVDLSEQGLVVPVIRDADGLNLRGLARAIRAVADKANAGRATPDDLAGSTFTITNPGPFGGYASAPDHQPAELRDPVGQRGDPPPHGRRQRGRGPLHDDPRVQLRPPGVRRRHRVPLPRPRPRRAPGPGLGRRARIVRSKLLTCAP